MFKLSVDVSEITSKTFPWRNSVEISTTSNINIASIVGTTIDGRVVLSTDRVLVKNQTITSQNGVYINNKLAIDSDVDVGFGIYYVKNGTINGGLFVTGTPASSFSSSFLNGTVRSVDLSAPNIFSVSGSPITNSGTLSLTLNSQSANLIFASPNGSSGIPSFRSLTTSDLPLFDPNSVIYANSSGFLNGNSSAFSFDDSSQVFALRGKTSFLTITNNWNSNTGVWVNMSIDGPSGIGSGEIGENAWIAFCDSAGRWFTDSNKQDIAYRNLNGDLLFGATADRYQLNLNKNNFVVSTPIILNSTLIDNNGVSGDVNQVLASTNTGVNWVTLASFVSSVSLSLPSIFTVSGSPITSSGTLSATLNSQTANLIFASPNGSSGTPSFRALVNTDLPNSGVTANTYNSLTVNSKGIVTSGTNVSIVNTFNTRSGTVIPTSGDYTIAQITNSSVLASTTNVTITSPSNNQILTFNGSVWVNSTPTFGSVSSVGLSLPSIFTVSGSPITSSGTISATLNSQSTNLIFASPDGSSGVPSFRSLTTNDLPSIPNSKLQNSSISFSTGTTGSDFNLSGSPTSLGGTLTLNLPDAGASSRGLISTGSQTIGGAKTFNNYFALSSGTFSGSFSAIQNRFNIGSSVFNDTASLANAVNSYFTSCFIDRPTINATNTGNIIRIASTVQINGPPIAGTNETITLPYVLSTMSNTPSTVSNSLFLCNTGGGAGSGINIDMSTYDLPSNSATTPPCRISLLDNNFGGTLRFLMKTTGSATNSLVNPFSIDDLGIYIQRRLFDSTTSSGTNGQVLTSTGTNVTWSSISSGVTSVALALPSIFSVSGSPITTTGTLTGTLVSQTANRVFASPNGSSGVPTFRAIVASDLPTFGLNSVLFGNSSGVVSTNSTSFTWDDTAKLLSLLNTSTTIPLTGGESLKTTGPIAILNGTNDFTRFISALDNAMSTSTSRYITFGQSATSLNQAELAFTYVGSSSNSNSLALGLYGTGCITMTNNLITMLKSTKFNSTISDVSSSVGTNGQVLSSTGSGISWISPVSVSGYTSTIWTNINSTITVVLNTYYVIATNCTITIPSLYGGNFPPSGSRFAIKTFSNITITMNFSGNVVANNSIATYVNPTIVTQGTNCLLEFFFINDSNSGVVQWNIVNTQGNWTISSTKMSTVADINQIANVSISNPLSSQKLYFDGTNWVNGQFNAIITYIYTASAAIVCPNNATTSLLSATNNTIYGTDNGQNSTTSASSVFSLSSATGGQGLLYTGDSGYVAMIAVEFATAQSSSALTTARTQLCSAITTTAGFTSSLNVSSRPLPGVITAQSFGQEGLIRMTTNYKYAPCLNNTSGLSITMTIAAGSRFTIVLL